LEREELEVEGTQEQDNWWYTSLIPSYFTYKTEKNLFVYRLERKFSVLQVECPSFINVVNSTYNKHK